MCLNIQLQLLDVNTETRKGPVPRLWVPVDLNLWQICSAVNLDPGYEHEGRREIHLSGSAPLKGKGSSEPYSCRLWETATWEVTEPPIPVNLELPVHEQLHALGISYPNLRGKLLRWKPSMKVGDLLSYFLRLNHHSRGDHTDTTTSFEAVGLVIEKDVVAEA